MPRYRSEVGHHTVTTEVSNLVRSCIAAEHVLAALGERCQEVYHDIDNKKQVHSDANDPPRKR